MTTAQAIAARVQVLPEQAQQEVLDFIEFLAARRPAALAPNRDDAAWSEFSLASALAGMEDEVTPYTSDDVKESFR